MPKIVMLWLKNGPILFFSTKYIHLKLLSCYDILKHADEKISIPNVSNVNLNNGSLKVFLCLHSLINEKNNIFWVHIFLAVKFMFKGLCGTIYNKFLKFFQFRKCPFKINYDNLKFYKKWSISWSINHTWQRVTY